MMLKYQFLTMVHVELNFKDALEFWAPGPKITTHPKC